MILAPCVNSSVLILLSIFIVLTVGRLPQVALVVKTPPANAGDGRAAGTTPGSGGSLGGGHGNPLLAWEIPRMEEPRGPRSVGLQRVEHN